MWQDRISRLVERRAGLVLSESTKQRLDSFVAKRCISLGLASPERYVHVLETEQLPAEFQEILNTVTVSKTAFFRYPKHIDAICRYLLPSLDRTLDAGKPINIWSAAVSTGEEPYSLAMALDHHGWFTRRPITLFGTDINDVSLTRARKGEYHLDSGARAKLPSYAWNYLESAPGAQRYRLSERLRARVELVHANLNALTIRDDVEWHVVLCCNVLIYFDEANRQRVISSIQARMAHEAALLLGGAEITSATDPAYRVQSVAGCFAHLRGSWRGLPGPPTREVSASAGAAPAISPDVTPEPAPAGRQPDVPGEPATVVGAVVARGAQPVRVPSASAAQGAPIISDPSRWRGHARTLLDASRFAETCDLLDAVREQDPFCPEVHYLYGQALRELGRRDEAEGAFRRAVFLDPDFAIARYELGLLRHQQGDFQAALREYQRVLASVSSRGARELKPSGAAATDRELQEARDIERFMERACVQNRERALAGLLPTPTFTPLR